MRHCFISWSYINGGSTRSLNEYCLALSRANHQVTLMARGDGAPYFINKNLYVVPIDTKSNISEKIVHGMFFWKVVRYLRKESFDTINVFSSPGISILPLLLGKKGAQWLIHIRTSTIGNSINNKLKNFMLRHEVKLFKRVTIIDKNISQIIGFSKKQVNKMIELPLGINPDDFSKLPDLRFDIFGEKIRGKVIFIYVGTMDPTRRLDKLLASVRIVKEAGHDISLIMLGTGSHVPELIKQADDTGLSESVIFVGKVPQDQVSKYISSADIGITYIPITPVYNHQPPLKALEYLQMEIPQVATSTAVIRKVIRNNVNGVLRTDTPEDYADGMISLLENKSLKISIKERSKEGLSDYYWDNICKQVLIPCYEELLSNKTQ